MQLITTTKTPLPAFTQCGGQRYTGRPTRALRRRLRSPEKLTVSEWAARHRVVTSIDSAAGAWDIELVPWLKKPMDTISLPHVREVWMCAPERAGKTQLLMNAAFWGIDQGSKGGSIFWLMPREKDARDAMGDRIIPAMRQRQKNGKPNRLARYLSDKDDDTKRGMVRFNHGLFLRPAWSNSAAALASYFGYINIADEVDKFETTSKEGTNPVELFRKRARDDRDRTKYIFASTPGAGRYIYSGAMECEQVWQFLPRCPDCDEHVAQNETHLDCEDQQFKAAKVACPECGSLWDEHTRQGACYSGAWVCIQGEQIARPETVGFHMSGFALPKIKLKELAEKWNAAQDGGISERHNWAHGYLCKSYEPENVATVDVDLVLKFKSDLPRNLVPPDTVRLALVVDTQQSSFYFQVWAYGYAPEVKMHMIRHGLVETFADVEGLLQEVYLDHDGTEHRISNGLIDSGGTKTSWQKHSRTVEVYEWCSRNRGMVPLKGVHGRTGDLISYKQMETYPGTNKRIPGGLKRANVRVDLFKDELERRLGVEPDDPGALSFHCDIDEAFARHYTGERKDEAGDWKHNKKQRIDYWDCTNYALVLREIIKLRLPKKPGSETKPRRRIYSKGVQP